MNLREKYLSCDDKRRDCVALAQFGGEKVWFRALSGIEVDSAHEQAEKAGVHVGFVLAVLSAEDESGKRVFKDGDELALATKPHATTIELRRAALAANGYGAPATENAEKN